MRLLHRLLARRSGPPAPPTRVPRDAHAVVAPYRRLLRIAPPEALEQAHAEAFARLSAEERRQVLAGLLRETPDADWARSYDSFSLARVAARAEVRRPGTLERTLNRSDEVGAPPTPLLASVAAAFMGTAVAQVLAMDGEQS